MTKNVKCSNFKCHLSGVKCQDTEANVLWVVLEVVKFQ